MRVVRGVAILFVCIIFVLFRESLLIVADAGVREARDEGFSPQGLAAMVAVFTIAVTAYWLDRGKRWVRQEIQAALPDPVVEESVPQAPPVSPLVSGGCPVCGGVMRLRLVEVGRWEEECGSCGRIEPLTPRVTATAASAAASQPLAGSRPGAAGKP